MMAYLVAWLLLSFGLDGGEPAEPDAEKAPITFGDVQALYQQNARALQPLRLRWKLRVTYTEAYQKATGIELAGQEPKLLEFWTDGQSWRMLVPWGETPRGLPAQWLGGTPRGVASRVLGYHVVVYDAQRDRIVVITADKEREYTGAAVLANVAGFKDAFPPLSPVRGRTLEKLRQALHLMDQVMLADWATTHHVCSRCDLGVARHYFELLGDEVPPASYLTPEEREQYGARVRKYTGWIVEADLTRGGLPIRLWAWDRTYFDDQDVTPVGPLGRVEHDPPVMEADRVRQLSSGAHYPVHVTVRRFIPSPESGPEMPSFEERVLRRGRRFAYTPALGIVREWDVLTVEAGVDTPAVVFDSTAIGPRVYDATRLSGATVTSGRGRVPGEPAAGALESGHSAWVPFTMGFALAILGLTLAVGVWRARRCKRSSS